MRLWSRKQEKIFFEKSRNFASYDQLFYKTNDDRFVAYWPKGYDGLKSTLQARNSLIGNYTEKWVSDLIKHLLEDKNLYVVQQAQIPAIGISRKSPADIAIATENKKVLMPDEVKLIFEVKMSLVWNWEYDVQTSHIREIGDYRTHQGRPSFTRSDSILKAIGKCIDIRVSNFKSSKIPLIVDAHIVDGIIEIVRVHPMIAGRIHIGYAAVGGDEQRPVAQIIQIVDIGNVLTGPDVQQFESLDKLFNQELNFFSGMQNPKKLGQLIELANREKTYQEKGLKFINLLKRS